MNRSQYQTFLDIHPRVAEAFRQGEPVVALESTIISHGMPYPRNIEMARAVEDLVRQGGAVPATIGIVGGRLKAGLTEEEIELLASTPGVVKVSRRDLPVVVARSMHGATTVASTMIVADLAGIGVFVTGGIGGVHRGAEQTMDISADLQELARTSVAVVCAGAKSILDIGLTLEYLETRGVPVLGYGTDDFPAFYTRSSGFGVDYRLDSPREVAQVLRTKRDLGLSGGVVLANPVPAEYEMDPVAIDRAIEQALEEAREGGISGKETTPFLLSRVKDLTGGASLNTNIQLVYNNARVGAAVASALSREA
ncbi:pseudouridine-5-phosphate glycosidase [Alkalispirochaeta sphaeroplastigenens]|uniref:Pseudouridine-5'-phosphate glycosidase n=1 Tax=Alkalispirochaeta sphaeroplastigenens TaxID=1187066 RepID=A0A2S4JHV7_9SPIO|nr:pseudouridine-5'-phosphate glycosidase [Alkalispirochaeta sphaeroplastigenens]POQ99116.1 pseudouridine-5-phosphate glycosidase [Alkalispirochaeta sphaeroplastigenens]